MKNPTYQKHSSKIHVLIAASLTLVRESLQQLLESSGEIAVTQSGIDESSLLDSLSSNQPDVILLYLMDGDTETVKIISQLQKTASNAKFIVLTAEKDWDNQTLAVKLGAQGILHKQQSAKSLLKAIEQVCQGETWINHQLLARLVKNELPDKKGKSKCRERFGIESLTQREKEVVMVMGGGFKNKQIARNLSIGEATVRHHLSSIYGKLCISNRLNLIIYAYQYGLIPMPHEKSNGLGRIKEKPVI